MKLLSGDETGLLKCVDVRKKRILSRFGDQARKNAVEHVMWPDAQSARAASQSTQGVVEVWDVATQQRLHRCTNTGEDSVLFSQVGQQFVTATSSGAVRLFEQGAMDASTSVKLEIGRTISTAQAHGPSGTLAVGGKGYDLTLWDLESGKATFAARNVPHSKLDQRLPVWVTGIQFLPQLGAQAAAESSNRSASQHVLATVTGFKQVRLYDVRAQRRPVRSVDLGDFPLTTTALSHDSRSMFVGDTAGYLRRMDLSNLRVLGAYGGIGGAIRSISVWPGRAQPLVATASLDRCVRIHHIETRVLMRRIYLKQRLTAAAFEPYQEEAGTSGMEAEPDVMAGKIRLATDQVAAAAAAAAAEGSDGEDDVWDELERRAAATAAAAAGEEGADGGAGAAALGSKRPRALEGDSEEEGEEGEGGGDEEDDDDDAADGDVSDGEEEEEEEDGDPDALLGGGEKALLKDVNQKRRQDEKSQRRQGGGGANKRGGR